jgi:shikimate kinase
VTGTIANTDFANSMMYRLTAATTFRVSTVTALTSVTATGGGVFISDADIAAGKKAYILARINYLQAEPAVSWNEIQGFIDFASQVGGDDS